MELSSSGYVVKMTGRHKYLAKVSQEFATFQYWLSNCNAVRPPNAGVAPKRLDVSLMLFDCIIEFVWLTRVLRFSPSTKIPPSPSA